MNDILYFNASDPNLIKILESENFKEIKFDHGDSLLDPVIGKTLSKCANSKEKYRTEAEKLLKLYNHSSYVNRQVLNLIGELSTHIYVGIGNCELNIVPNDRDSYFIMGDISKLTISKNNEERGIINTLSIDASAISIDTSMLSIELFIKNIVINNLLLYDPSSVKFDECKLIAKYLYRPGHGVQKNFTIW